MHDTDQPENTNDNPKSWIAWKRRAETAEASLAQRTEALHEAEAQLEAARLRNETLQQSIDGCAQRVSALTHELEVAQKAHAAVLKVAMEEEAHLAQMREALEQAWQPIETAPKDGTRILVFDESWCGGLPQQRVSYWQPYAVQQRANEPLIQRGSWMGVSIATHWMPLPEPPAALAAAPTKERGE
jgi:hypothetical protein